MKTKQQVHGRQAEKILLYKIIIILVVIVLGMSVSIWVV